MTRTQMAADVTNKFTQMSSAIFYIFGSVIICVEEEMRKCVI